MLVNQFLSCRFIGGMVNPIRQSFLILCLPHDIPVSDMQTSAYQSVLRFLETSCPAHSDRYLQVSENRYHPAGNRCKWRYISNSRYTQLSKNWRMMFRKRLSLIFLLKISINFFVIDVIKTTLYIALDKPDHACEVRRNLTECGMTAFARSETVGVAVKDRFIDSF